MRLELDQLEGKTSKFAHTYEPEEIILDDEDARLSESPEIVGRLERSGQEVRLRGQIKARAEVGCDRCLKTISLPVETDFDVRYVPAVAYTDDSPAELKEEDLSVSVFDGDAIDIDELVREQLLLALPPRALCKEECKGLCPVCGADRNQKDCACQARETDPRWAGLASLKLNGKDDK